MKKTLSTFLLIAILIMAFALPVSAAVQPVNDLKTDYNAAIANTLEWAKQGKSTIFNDDFLSSGSVGGTYGDWIAFSIGRSGYNENKQLYLDALEDYITDTYAKDGKLDKNKTTEWQRPILAILALGGDPLAFGEKADGKPINLVADGIYNPLISNLWRQGINGAIWGLIALDAGGFETPAGAAYDREKIIDHILGEEISGGGFALTGTNPDPDITAMALTALAPYYKSDNDVKAAVDRALTVLSGQQKNDGDYATFGTVNAESTAWVLVALCALDIDPTSDSRFLKDGKSVLDGLYKYYVSADGAFAHSFVHDPENPSAVAGKSNAMATDQSRYALIAFSRLKAGEAALFDCTDVYASPGGTVSLRIEGISSNILYDKKVEIYKNDTVKDMVIRELTARNMPYKVNPYEYFESINNVSERTFDHDYDGWMYSVNGKSPVLGMVDYVPKDGDDVVLYYGPMSIAYPDVKIESQKSGETAVTVQYSFTDWLADPPTTSDLPLEGATITVAGKNYTTDKDGKVNFTVSPGRYRIALSKVDATKVVNNEAMPLVVRLAPDAAFVVPGVPAEQMTDVKKDIWYFNDVKWVVEQGIMMGTGATTFGIDAKIKRCDFITVLGRYEGILDASASAPAAASFSDVKNTSYYASHVAWGSGNEIINGTGNGKFSPLSNITRQDLATLMARYAKYAGIELPGGSKEAKFADDGSIAGYAKDAVYSMKAAGIIAGKGNNNFDPNGNATRQEAAKIFHLLLTY